MRKTLAAVASSVVRASLFGETHVRPLFPLYHITPFCNLRCDYCEGFPEVGLPGAAASRAPDRGRTAFQLDTDGVLRLLALLRQAFDSLFVTGGEPLVRDDIETVLRAARRMGFRVSLNTNGVLLGRKEAVLEHVADVVLSLDTLDPERYARTIGSSPATAARVLENLERCAAQQQRWGYQLVVHCVVRPEALDEARDLLRWCTERRIRICLSPLHVRYRVGLEGEALAAHRAFVQEVIDAKRRGASVSGSYAFYENVRELAPYTCLPMLVPRILPTGELLYPCRPRGRNAGSLLEHGSWKAALAQAVARFGKVGRCTESCRIRCYIEPSLLVRRPLALVREFA